MIEVKKIKVEIEYRDGDREVREFTTMRAANVFAGEECSWEHTVRAIVHNTDGTRKFFRGDYA